MSKYHIVYSRGRSQLAVVEICEGMEYELSDYSVASSQSFDSRDEANEYANDLAKRNGLAFNMPNSYLD